MRSGLNFDELKASGNLPSPAGVALALFQLTLKPDVSLAEIGHIVQADPVLSGKLIKYANHLKAGSRVIASIPDALNLLGMAATRQIALGFSVLNNNRQGACKGFDYMRFWSQSLARAIVAQMICEKTRVAQPEECFIGALLFGVGSLALATLYPAAYSEILSGGSSGPVRLELERSRFATDHLELTVALLEDWMLPPLFARVALHQEDPDSMPFPKSSREYKLCRIWHFSGALAEDFLSGGSRISSRMPDLLREAKELGFDQEEFGALCDRASASWQEWGRILDVPSRHLPSFEEMMAAIPQDAPRTGESVPGLQILLIAREPALSELSGFLSSQGHAVLTASTEEEAMRLVLEADPQLVLCEFSVPDLAGPAFIEALRRLPSGRLVYAVLLAEQDDLESQVEAFEAGADDCIVLSRGQRFLAVHLLAARRFVEMREELSKDREELRNVASDLAVANRRAQEASLTDPLSGLPNRRYAMERMAWEWNRPGDLACMMLDIDRFKSINDLYGHDVGDKVIRHFAHVLRKASRAQDVICRFGGEEFLAILPDANPKAAEQCAERIRAAVESFPFVDGKVRIPVTASIGVAIRNSGMGGFDAFIKAADVALYNAKQAGRNLVRIAK